MQDKLVDFLDDTLFGNSASEDEDNTVFDAYKMERSEIKRFISDEKLCIIKTLKGCGKSAVIRISEKVLSDSGNIVISLCLSDLTTNVESNDPDVWVKEWKKSLYIKIAETIGAQKDIPVDEYKDEVKKFSQSACLSDSNFIDSIKKLFSSISALSLASKCLGTEAKVEIKRQVDGNNITKEQISNIISEYLSKKVFFLIDDLDHNFINTGVVKSKIVGLLTACRYIANKTPLLKFRLTLRPNTWNIIKREYPSMNSHINQYIVELYWSRGQIKQLLTNRITGYLKRNGETNLPTNAFALVFETGPWDKEIKEAHIPISSYAKCRPRWAKEIFKFAARHAQSRNSRTISFDDIIEASNTFGETAIVELCAEFCCEFEDIEKYINAFRGQYNSYKFDELIKTIKNRIIEPSPLSTRPQPKEVAQALFYCGFLYARENIDNIYKTYSFLEKPYLLTKDSLDDGKYEWEIDLIFRSYLEIKNKIHSVSKVKRRLF
ncbi:hypothetical protein JMF94_13010 [Desulfovibrio sp. UIB00]|uniref:P-loop ATPase, Sll1717 family n=1 Tax=Desulfovibrio sp. UIB00 TaxID=2804314 RepID=UPI001F0CF96E|nr:hypothetical protein [Desulfovibrio sp. UIB00]MCH5146003.1 hypothetical protein [Desulfovibrio sp. UIB00]